MKWVRLKVNEQKMYFGFDSMSPDCGTKYVTQIRADNIPVELVAKAIVKRVFRGHYLAYSAGGENRKILMGYSSYCPDIMKGVADYLRAQKVVSVSAHSLDPYTYCIITLLGSELDEILNDKSIVIEDVTDG